MKKAISYFMALVLLAFGLLTLFLSTSLLLDLFGVREKEGNYVLVVVWANFFSALLYLSSAFGFIKNAKWTSYLLAINLIIMILAYFGFVSHVNGGGLYEAKTFGALAFRISASVVFLLTAYFTITRSKAIE